MAVIDLGIDDGWTPVDTPRPSRRLPVRTRAGLALVLILALVGGAAPPAAPLLSVVADVAAPAAPTVLLTATDVYLGDRDGTVTDHRLPGGATRWRTRVPFPAGVLSYDPTAGVLVVAAPSDVPQFGELSVLSGERGASLWSTDHSTVIDALPGQLLLERDDPATAPLLRWLDIRTGDVRWLRTIPPGADVAAGGDLTGTGTVPILVTGVDGTATLLDATTGGVVAVGNFGSLVSNIVLTPGSPAGGVPPGPGRDPVSVFGDSVLVQARRGAAPGSLTAFDVGTLAHRWAISGDLLGVPFRCGPYVCVGSVDGLRAVDPASGEIRWQSKTWQYATALGSDMLVAFSIGTPAGSGTEVGGDRQTTGVVDARTGRTVQDFGASYVRLIANGSGPALLATAGGQIGFTLYQLDPDPYTMRLIGLVPGIDPRFCQSAGDKLACVTQRGDVRIWRLRP